MVIMILLALLVIAIGAVQVVSGGIGGTEPKNNEGSFVAYIYQGGTEVAMGSLVDRRWVLTLAFYVPPWQTYMVQLGNGEDGQMELYYVDDIVYHPNFTGWFLNDVALLHLSSPAKVGQPHINLVDGVASLPVADTIKLEQRRCFYYVKGKERSANGIYGDRKDLAKISTRFINCKNDFEVINYDPVYQNQLACTKSNFFREMPCMDIGAPLMCRYQGEWYLTGMFGAVDNRNECRSSEIIASEVAMHKPWIRSVIG